MYDKNITILLADDHTVVRQGLAKLLESEGDFKVVGEAENGREAIEKADTLKPDIVLMDIAMPMLNGIEATRQIKKNVPETRVLILSMHSHDRYVDKLFSLGASGYLLKNSTGSDIKSAIYAAIMGNIYLSPSISRRVIEEYVSMKNGSLSDELYGKLSNREREVFQMIAEGRATRDIADILCISPSTVKSHRAKIMEKLQVDNVSHLIQFAIRMGIVEMQP